MIRRFLTLSLPIFLVLTLMFPTNSMAITAEDRLIEVERQLQKSLSKSVTTKVNLLILKMLFWKTIKIYNKSTKNLQKCNQGFLLLKELEKALENYDGTLNDLAEVQQTIVQEQTKLGKIKNEISNVSDELFETQKNLVEADDKLRTSCKPLHKWCYESYNSIVRGIK